MKNLKNLKRVVLLTSIFSFSSAYAGELVYTPVNPAFGGNPLNSSYLLGVANAINDHKAPASDYEYEEISALESLAANLQSRLLSQLLSDVGGGNSGQLITEDFVLNVIDNDGGLVVNIIDKNTGESSTIEVSGLIPDL